jgi:hypothetical protein
MHQRKITLDEAIEVLVTIPARIQSAPAEVLFVDVAGRGLVVEEGHEGGSAVFGDGAFAAPGNVEALGGFDVTGRYDLVRPRSVRWWVESR